MVYDFTRREAVQHGLARLADYYTGGHCTPGQYGMMISLHDTVAVLVNPNETGVLAEDSKYSSQLASQGYVWMDERYKRNIPPQMSVNLSVRDYQERPIDEKIGSVLADKSLGFGLAEDVVKSRMKQAAFLHLWMGRLTQAFKYYK